MHLHQDPESAEELKIWWGSIKRKSFDRAGFASILAKIWGLMGAYPPALSGSDGPASHCTVFGWQPHSANDSQTCSLSLQTASATASRQPQLQPPDSPLHTAVQLPAPPPQTWHVSKDKEVDVREAWACSSIYHRPQLPLVLDNLIYFNFKC